MRSSRHTKRCRSSVIALWRAMPPLAYVVPWRPAAVNRRQQPLECSVCLRGSISTVDRLRTADLRVVATVRDAFGAAWRTCLEAASAAACVGWSEAARFAPPALACRRLIGRLVTVVDEDSSYALVSCGGERMYATNDTSAYDGSNPAFVVAVTTPGRVCVVAATGA
ncbi:MAG: hypothetical protein QOG93_83 [Gaiellaceae bacterium]|nr:hypothetical protein [Gaiellaceae bacterium]